LKEDNETVDNGPPEDGNRFIVEEVGKVEEVGEGEGQREDEVEDKTME
jgi:hypothetical protein